jgi:hypothetical protein
MQLISKKIKEPKATALVDNQTIQSLYGIYSPLYSALEIWEFHGIDRQAIERTIIDKQIITNFGGFSMDREVLIFTPNKVKQLHNIASTIKLAFPYIEVELGETLIYIKNPVDHNAISREIDRQLKQMVLNYKNKIEAIRNKLCVELPKQYPAIANQKNGLNLYKKQLDDIITELSLSYSNLAKSKLK